MGSSLFKRRTATSSSGLRLDRLETQSESSTSTPAVSTSGSIVADNLPMSVHTEGPDMIKKTVELIRRNLANELGCMDKIIWDGASIRGFLSYIDSLRMSQMPPNGGCWDKILKDAQCFGVRVFVFQELVGTLIPDSSSAAELVWACCRMLLELGSGQVSVLEKAFGTFYALIRTLALPAQSLSMLSNNADITESLGRGYADLLHLVTDVTLYFHKKIHEVSASTALLDLNDAFRQAIEIFSKRKDGMIETIWDYQLQLAANSDGDVTIDARELRRFLVSPDLSVRSSASVAILHNKRIEFAWEWFEKHLLKFLEGQHQTLVITGKSGCGKSCLFDWIVEWLQRPWGKKSYRTIFHRIEMDIPMEATSSRLVRSLLLQLLEQNNGNMAVFRELISAFEVTTRSKDATKRDNAMWTAFGTITAICAKSGEMVIVIDGLDEVAGGETEAFEIFQRLYDATAEYPTIRIIVLSQSFSRPLPSPNDEFIMTSDHSHDDVYQMAQSRLADFDLFQEQSQHDGDLVVGRIATRADGSFIWADVTTEILKKQKDFEGLLRALGKVPRSLTSAVEKLMLDLDLSHDSTKIVLSWLIIAQRLLTVTEIGRLLDANATRRTSNGADTDTADDIVHSFRSLLFIRNGTVRFRHKDIRQYLLGLSGKSGVLLSLADAQSDFTFRLLAIAKMSCGPCCSPMMENLPFSDIEERFRANSLYEYAARYWIMHFRQSSMYDADNYFVLPAGFQGVFPDSATFSVIERMCWETQSSTPDAVKMLILAVAVRRQVFGELHESVLQALINVAASHQAASNLRDASVCLFEAATLSQKLLGNGSPVTKACATSYLACVEPITNDTPKDIVHHTEDILKVLIEISKRQCGNKYGDMIGYRKALNELYTKTNEVFPTAATLQGIYDAFAERCGPSSNETLGALRDFAELLEKDPTQSEDSIQFSQKLFEATEQNIHINDPDRVQATTQLAKAYESQREFLKAEEAYVTLWRKLIEANPDHIPRASERNKEADAVAMTYVNFLRRGGRDTEASNILIGLWNDIGTTEFKSESIVDLLKQLAAGFESLGLAALAWPVLTATWNAYKVSGTQHSMQAIPTAVSITRMALEMQDDPDTSSQARDLTFPAAPEKVPNSGSHILTTSSTPDVTLREVFDSTISRCSNGQIDVPALNILETISSYHVRGFRWDDVIETTQAALRFLWPSLMVRGRETALPEKFVPKAITIAERLAYSYHQANRLDQAEQIYLSLYRAASPSTTLQDGLVNRACQSLVELYEKSGQVDKLVKFYEDQVKRYRHNAIKSSHPVNIRTLYALASLCSVNKRKNADRYYEEIVTSLSDNSGVCHVDALDAAIRLTGLYHEDKRWKEEVRVCEILWQTFVKRGKECKVTADTMETVYRRYTEALAKHVPEASSVLRPVTEEYYKFSSDIFGNRSAISAKAAFELAQVDEQIEEHRGEVIMLYEAVIDKAKTDPITADMNAVSAMAKERLAYLYVSAPSSDSIAAPSGCNEKAISLFGERYENAKTQHGCSDDRTLRNLAELVNLYKQDATSESRSRALSELQNAGVEILSNEASPVQLSKSAKTLAMLYRSSGYSEQAYEFVTELRRQIIFKDMGSPARFEFDLDPSVDRNCYIFIVSFEEALQSSKPKGFSYLMTELLTEAMMYETYSQLIPSDQDLDSCITCGTRLHSFLVSKGRPDLATMLEDEMFELFWNEWSSTLKTGKQKTRTFFTGLLEQITRAGPNVPMDNSICITVNELVEALLQQSRFQDAYEVASYVFRLIKSRRAFQIFKNITHGIRLALLMASDGASRPDDQELRHQTLDLSEKIVHELIDVCRNAKFVPSEMSELQGFASLLNEQQNYEDLEWLLTELWSCRDIQKTWSAQDTIWIGKQLVEVRCFLGDRDSAISLCESITYNLKTVKSPLDKLTLEMSTLLSQLYNATGRRNDAVAVHEDIIRQIFSGEKASTTTKTIMIAKTHLGLLKQAEQRSGVLAKGTPKYDEWRRKLEKMFGKPLPGPEIISSRQGRSGSGRIISHASSLEGSDPVGSSEEQECCRDSGDEELVDKKLEDGRGHEQKVTVNGNL